MSLPGEKLLVNGVHYHISDQGQGDQVVFMLHGMPDTSELWRHQADTLVKAGFRVIVPDMLGYGLTDMPQDHARYDGEQIIADLLAMMDQLGLDGVDIVGHDWGAFASWELVLAFPEKFRRHVAVSVGHLRGLFGNITEEILQKNWYMYLNGQEEANELYLPNKCAFFCDYVIPGHPDADEVVSRISDPKAMRAMLNWDRGNPMSAFYHGVLSGALEYPDCQVPTMGIWSEGDHALWEEQMTGSSKYMKADWRYERLPGSHWVMMDHPQEVSDLMLDWLK